MLPLGKEHRSPEIEEVMFEPCPGVNKKLSLMAQMIKNLPAMQETRVQSLDWEDLLEKEMAILVKIPPKRRKCKYLQGI